MAIDYKKELESAAKTMILVHKPDTLIKMIARLIVQKVKVSHSGILIYDPEKNTYVLTVSRGTTGVKIPPGFARMDADNALIRFFKDRIDKEILSEGALVYEDGMRLLSKNLGAETKQILKNALYQLEIFDSVACVPSYFRNDLIGILFLGVKHNNERFDREELDFFLALASDVAMAIRNAQLFHELELELEKKYRLFIHTTIALAAAIDAKDHYTHGHTARVTELSLLIAKKMSQKNKSAFDGKFLENLHIASLLHDIGKIGIPESILNKNGPLDEEERKRIQEHPVIGVSILKPIKELEIASLGVKYHHERFDGAGYPDGLKGDQIPLIASIIAVADTFDAMTTDRPYRKGLSKEEATKEIIRVSGRQLNPEITPIFDELFKEGKV